jgi:pentose-5-phosphate-3-epimerase
MLISPSIASADVLRVAEELDFIDRYFDNIHIDIEDGVAVKGISFGMKMARKICEYSKSKEKTIHLEVYEPLNYINDLLSCRYDVAFIQVSHIEEPLAVVRKMKESGIVTGLNLRVEDTERENFEELLDSCDHFLVSTTTYRHGYEEYLDSMEELAINLSGKKKIWVDGHIDYERFKRLDQTDIYCAVMGRAIFEDKDLAVRQYCQI